MFTSLFLLASVYFTVHFALFIEREVSVPAMPIIETSSEDLDLAELTTFVLPAIETTSEDVELVAITNFELPTVQTTSEDVDLVELTESFITLPVDYSGLGVRELRELVKAKGIKGFGRLKKSECLAILQ